MAPDSFLITNPLRQKQPHRSDRLTSEKFAPEKPGNGRAVTLVSVIVIGLNEEMRLKASLEAVFAHSPKACNLEVIYVDSGSTDLSVDIASGISGVNVLHLKGGKPSAARARNIGLQRARGQYVQLVDGDSVIQPGWLDKALQTMELDPGVSCVFGHCVEMYPQQSIYMKVCGLDWHMTPGERRLCGGNSLWRMSVIAENGFFDEKIRLGEEPELCYRVRQKGGRILCIDAPMVTHDLGMHSFGQYWKRSVNSGKAYASIAMRFRKNTEKMWLREMLINFVEPGAWVLLFSGSWIILGLTPAVAIIVCWWLVRGLQIANTLRKRKLGRGTAMLYGLHCQFARLPVAVGQLTALFSSGSNAA